MRAIRRRGEQGPLLDRGTGQPSEERSDVWPATPRLLPWLIAALLGFLWIVPFDSVRLPGPLSSGLLGPDRLFIGGLVVLWLVVATSSEMVVGPVLRRWSLATTLIAFIAVLALGVVLRLDDLSALGELNGAVRAFGLVVCSVALYALLWSVLTPAEVRNLAVLSIGLAALVSVGLLVEFRTGTNLFYDLASSLPGVTVRPEPTALEYYRAAVVGPTRHGLAVTAMLAMTLPFALVEFLRSRSRAGRVAAGIAVLLICIGAFVTLRRTAIIAPVVAIAVLFLLRPREVFRATPVFASLLVAAQVVAPGVLGGLRKQLFGGTVEGENSIAGRTDDYSAVTPDVLSHLLLGRGFGSYDPLKYRILDNQYLDFVIEGGVVGLIAYAAVIAVAGLIAFRLTTVEPREGLGVPAACLAAIVTFAVVNALFDVFAFPQVLYLFMVVLAFVSVEEAHRDQGLRAGAATPTTEARGRGREATRGPEHLAGSLEGAPSPGPWNETLNEPRAQDPRAVPSSRLHLAASPGGHMALLRQVEGAFSDHERTWVTAGSGPQTRALLQAGERVVRLRMADRSRPAQVLANAIYSAIVAVRERPTLIVTSGAGIVLPFCIVSRLLGSHVVFIETMARVDGGSITGRTLARLGARVIVQWPETLRVYPRAVVARPALLEVRADPDPSLADPRTGGTFVALGTHTQPFARLVGVVDDAVRAGVLPGPVTAQVGVTAAPPAPDWRVEQWMPASRMAEAAAAAEVVICHAGSGIIAMALAAGKRPIVVPRRERFGEHVDDHQLQLAAKLEELGAVVVATEAISPDTVEVARGGTVPGATYGEGPRLIAVLEDTLRSGGAAQ